MENTETMEKPDESRAPIGYVPAARSVEEIFEDDERCAEAYANVCQDDEDVKLFHQNGTEEQNMTTIEKWDEVPFPDELMANILKTKYTKPRKIQGASIALVMDGHDIIGHAETGSGKTAAYLIPIIASIINCKKNDTWGSDVNAPLAIIIAPTRELVLQIYEQCTKFTQNTNVSVAKAYGQYSTARNYEEISNGCDILCATVGRLKHFCTSGQIRCNLIKFIVLDEADVLIEHNFASDIRDITECTGFPSKENRQTLLFSATFTTELQALVNEMTREDKCVKISMKRNVTNKRIKQSFIAVDDVEKKGKLVSLLKAEKDGAAGDASEMRRTLIFVNGRRDCDLIAFYLSGQGIPCASINGDRGQHLREEALNSFRRRKVVALVATDVLARGIDIHDLDHVINFSCPFDLVTYIHRIGRVGRIKPGFATSFIIPGSKDIELLNALQKNLIENSMDVPEDLSAIIEQCKTSYPTVDSNRGGQDFCDNQWSTNQGTSNDDMWSANQGTSNDDMWSSNQQTADNDAWSNNVDTAANDPWSGNSGATIDHAWSGNDVVSGSKDDSSVAVNVANVSVKDKQPSTEKVAEDPWTANEGASDTEKNVPTILNSNETPIKDISPASEDPLSRNVNKSSETGNELKKNDSNEGSNASNVEIVPKKSVGHDASTNDKKEPVQDDLSNSEDPWSNGNVTTKKEELSNAENKLADNVSSVANENTPNKTETPKTEDAGAGKEGATNSKNDASVIKESNSPAEEKSPETEDPWVF